MRVSRRLAAAITALGLVLCLPVLCAQTLQVGDSTLGFEW